LILGLIFRKTLKNLHKVDSVYSCLFYLFPLFPFVSITNLSQPVRGVLIHHSFITDSAVWIDLDKTMSDFVFSPSRKRGLSS
jgi:hypothetical protein